MIGGERATGVDAFPSKTLLGERYWIEIVAADVERRMTWVHTVAAAGAVVAARTEANDGG